jgi:phage anti-repressor protein
VFDYEELSPRRKLGRSKEYRLTLDTAKRVSMVEGGEVGKLVRSYYLWSEGGVDRGAAAL